jgi:hypothetical protein
MFSKFRIAATLALFFALVLATTVLAGGWAVITLDKLPTDVSAGQPVTIGFTVLQHGRTPMPDLVPTVTLRSGTERIIVPAEEDGKAGHYTATLTFPTEGAWDWSIQAFTMDQPMPALSVSASAASSSATSTSTAPDLPALPLIAGVSMGIGLIGVAISVLRKNRFAITFTTLFLLIGAALTLAGTNPTAAHRDEPQKVEPSDISQVEYGRQLFLVKGCITCHHNIKAGNSSEYWTIDMGATDLSNFSASPEVLRIRLKDPSAAKSNTQMPNLELSEAEIEALIAFINSK